MQARPLMGARGGMAPGGSAYLTIRSSWATCHLIWCFRNMSFVRWFREMEATLPAGATTCFEACVGERVTLCFQRIPQALISSGATGRDYFQFVRVHRPSVQSTSNLIIITQRLARTALASCACSHGEKRSWGALATTSQNLQNFGCEQCCWWSLFVFDQ